MSGDDIPNKAKPPRPRGTKLPPSELAIIGLETGDPSLDYLRLNLRDERRQLFVSELVYKGVAELAGTLSRFDLKAGWSAQELQRRLDAYEDASHRLVKMLVVGARWGTDEQAIIWARAIERLANVVPGGNGLGIWLKLRLYPAMYALYAAGLAAIAGEQWKTIGVLLTKPRVREVSSAQPAAMALYPGNVVDTNAAQQLPGMERRFTPISDRLHERLQPILAPYLVLDYEYEEAFDTFEYLLGLVHSDLGRDEGTGSWGPVGRFGWRSRHSRDVLAAVRRTMDAEGANWGVLRAGAFRGSVDRLTESRDSYDALTARASAGWW